MKLIKRFLNSGSGNVAVMFGLSAVPLIAAGGMAIDYMSATRSQSALQQAVDDAALAAGASDDDSKKALRKIVKDSLIRNGMYDSLDHVTAIKVKKRADKKIKLFVEGKVNAKFLGLIGHSKLDVSATAVVNRDFGNLELALVLDNTGSMAADGKIDSLKSASKLLVNEIFDKKGSTADVKIGIVPFNDYVNVGVDKRGASWLDVPDDTSTTRSGTRDVTRQVPGSERNCGNRTSTSTNDGVTTTSTYYACDYDYEVTGTENYTETVTSTWNGCVGSRDYPLNVEDRRPNVKITGLMDQWCGRPITKLTDNKSTIVNELDAMTPAGNTYIPAGLMWGWRMLSKIAPLKDGVNYNKMTQKGYTKAIVLMTDGMNTLLPTYPLHEGDGGDATTANDLTAELCSNIKNTGTNEKEQIKIYTITFSVTDPTIKSLMKSCATNENYYFDASDRLALTAAFEKIGRSLITLRLVR